MKKSIYLWLVSAFLGAASFAQQTDSKWPIHNDKFSLGLGIGMDYGGIGGKVLFYPQQNIGVFGGLGYAFVGPGYNAGLKVRIVTPTYTQRVAPYFTGMYGYNVVIKVKNAGQYDKMYYGFTAGFGLDMYAKKARKGYWTLALTVPIRGAEVKDYITDLEENHGVVFTRDLLPVGFSFAYHIVIK